MSAGPSCRIRADAVGLGDAVLGGRAAEAARPCHAEQQVTARQVRYTRRQRWGAALVTERLFPGCSVQVVVTEPGQIPAHGATPGPRPLPSPR